MKAILLTFPVAGLIALGLGACGTTTSTSSFKGEEHAVAQTIADLQSRGTALEAKKICSQDLADAVVASLSKASGGCVKAIERQLKEIDSFEVTVESVRVSGSTATAQVKSIHEGKNAVYSVTLQKENGRWRISGVS